MEVAVATQNTPMHFQMPLAETHWHKKHILGFVISRTGITYKLSPNLCPAIYGLALFQPSLSILSSPDSPHLSPDTTAPFNCLQPQCIPSAHSMECHTAKSSTLSSITSLPLFVGRLLPTYHMRSAKSVSDLSSLTPPSLKLPRSLLFVLNVPSTYMTRPGCG